MWVPACCECPEPSRRLATASSANTATAPSPASHNRRREVRNRTLWVSEVSLWSFTRVVLFICAPCDVLDPAGGSDGSDRPPVKRCATSASRQTSVTMPMDPKGRPRDENWVVTLSTVPDTTSRTQTHIERTGEGNKNADFRRHTCRCRRVGGGEPRACRTSRSSRRRRRRRQRTERRRLQRPPSSSAHSSLVSLRRLALRLMQARLHRRGRPQIPRRTARGLTSAGSSAPIHSSHPAVTRSSRTGPRRGAPEPGPGRSPVRTPAGAVWPDGLIGHRLQRARILNPIFSRHRV